MKVSANLVVHRRDITCNRDRRALLKQRTCESFRRGASQHPSPTVPPSVRHRRLQSLALTVLWTPPTHQRTVLFNVRRLLQPRRPTWPGNPRQRARDRWSPFVSAHHPELHLVSWLHGGVECRRRAEPTPMWCPWPTELPGTDPTPSATTSRRRPSVVFTPGAKSNSRTNMLVITLPPASRQTRAAAVSKAKPRRPGTPICARGWETSERAPAHGAALESIKARSV